VLTVASTGGKHPSRMHTNLLPHGRLSLLHTTGLHVTSSQHVTLGNSRRSKEIRSQSEASDSSGWAGVKQGASPQDRVKQDILPATDSGSTQSPTPSESELPTSAVTTSFALSSNGSQPEAFSRPSEAYTPISSPGPSNSDATGMLLPSKGRYNAAFLNERGTQWTMQEY